MLFSIKFLYLVKCCMNKPMYVHTSTNRGPKKFCTRPPKPTLRPCLPLLLAVLKLHSNVDGTKQFAAYQCCHPGHKWARVLENKLC